MRAITDSWFPFAAVLAALALATMTVGATITSSLGSAAPSPETPYATLHQTLAWIAGLLAVILAGLIAASRENAVARGIGFAAAGAFALQATLGLAMLRGALLGFRITHACVAPVFLSLTAVLVVMGGKAWERGPDPVQDYGWPSMRSMGVAGPLLVLTQIAMGAAFRHQAMGVMPHILGAIVVALFIMIKGACVMHQFPAHKPLRLTAVALMTITGFQVFLGMGSFIMRMIIDGTPPLLIAVTAAHVVTGALTLAASTVLMVQIRRHVTPKPRP